MQPEQLVETKRVQSGSATGAPSRIFGRQPQDERSGDESKGVGAVYRSPIEPWKDTFNEFRCSREWQRSSCGNPKGAPWQQRMSRRFSVGCVGVSPVQCHFHKYEQSSLYVVNGYCASRLVRAPFTVELYYTCTRSTRFRLLQKPHYFSHDV